MEKLKKRSGKVVAEEDQLRMEGKTEVDSENGTIRDEFAVLCRDLYALYPLLIRYVDNNRWLNLPIWLPLLLHHLYEHQINFIVSLVGKLSDLMALTL